MLSLQVPFSPNIHLPAAGNIAAHSSELHPTLGFIHLWLQGTEVTVHLKLLFLAGGVP